MSRYSLYSIDRALAAKRARIEIQLGRSIATAPKTSPRASKRKESGSPVANPPKGTATATAKAQPSPLPSAKTKATKPTEAPDALDDSRMRTLLALSPVGRQVLRTKTKKARV